ncbi:carboxypeptidase regulatory-like domain-containing protein [Panacibacter ginsenosidivorans]|uniref:Carboxypeptidase regulatory-like domain-containing protein n=1 Tax=Panacibacter ginsenosidivorans TaxID=1813871 RepID=A0A5B8VDN6_9BACT|nr:carboxypeptidase-like regulatory domain-containing protein [Panacibacter ginsenosidivorans]QEC69584.1 carboxypeptidase regulatory-like domain-containing protein [Panacibacter ginsenosidivorans]
MKNILICFLLLGFSQFSFATGTKECTNCIFAGTVVDAATKRPVSDVMVIAHGQETGDEQKFTTDQHGQYKIASLPSGTYTIRFEKNNYRPVEKRNLAVKKASSGTKLNIEMVLSDEEEGEEDHHDWLPKYDII